MQDPLRPPHLAKIMLEKATVNFQDYALRDSWNSGPKRLSRRSKDEFLQTDKFFH